MKPGAQPVASSSACASRIHSGTILTWHGSPLSSTAIGDAHCTRFMLMLRARLLTTSVSSQDSRRAKGGRLPSTEGVSERSARIMILKGSRRFDAARLPRQSQPGRVQARFLLICFRQAQGGMGGRHAATTQGFSMYVAHPWALLFNIFEPSMCYETNARRAQITVTVVISCWSSKISLPNARRTWHIALGPTDINSNTHT